MCRAKIATEAKNGESFPSRTSRDALKVLSSRSTELSGTNHLKPIARARIPVRRRHAADKEQLVAANAFRRHVEEVVAHMQPFDQPNHDTIVADLQRAPLGAFQTDG